MTSCCATPPEKICLENGTSRYHLPFIVAKSWKTLEQSCRQIAARLRASFEKDHPKIFLTCSLPRNPSDFGYFTTHPSEERARFALSESLDAFVLLFAYVSFCIAISRTANDPLSIPSSTSKPRWFRDLSIGEGKIHPGYLQLLADSPLSNFTTVPQRLGMVVNVARCLWLPLVPFMLRANVPVWLYWGVPPAFGQPLDSQALIFAPRSHPQSRAVPLPEISPQRVGPRVPSGYGGSAQLPGETWRDFLIRIIVTVFRSMKAAISLQGVKLTPSVAGQKSAVLLGVKGWNL